MDSRSDPDWFAVDTNVDLLSKKKKNNQTPLKDGSTGMIIPVNCLDQADPNNLQRLDSRKVRSRLTQTRPMNLSRVRCERSQPTEGCAAYFYTYRST